MPFRSIEIIPHSQSQASEKLDILPKPGSGSGRLLFDRVPTDIENFLYPDGSAPKITEPAAIVRTIGNSSLINTTYQVEGTGAFCALGEPAITDLLSSLRDAVIETDDGDILALNGIMANRVEEGFRLDVISGKGEQKQWYELIATPVQQVDNRYILLKVQNVVASKVSEAIKAENVKINETELALATAEATIQQKDARIQQLEEQQDESTETQNWFINTVHSWGHALRNPLASIQGYAQLLRRSDLNAEENQKFVEIIEKQSRAMNGIVTDLLLSIDTMRKPKLEIVRTRDFLQSIISQNSALAAAYGVHMEARLPDIVEENTVDTNTNRVHFACNTIILNSVQNMEGQKRSKEITVWNERKAGRDFTFIKDTGTGMDELTQEKWRERGFSTKIGSSRESTGLGLSIAILGLAELGGEVHLIESKLEEGTTFAVSSPVPQEPGPIYDSC